MQKRPADFPFDCGVVLDVGGGSRGDVGRGMVDVVLLSGAGSAIFGYNGEDTVGGGGGGVDVPFFGIRGAVFGYRGGDSVGGGVGEPEECWSHPFGGVGS